LTPILFLTSAVGTIVGTDEKYWNYRFAIF
jgi:hypothetical protein